jgi:hypothetical protein
MEYPEGYRERMDEWAGRCSAVQCSAVQYSAVQCSAVQCSAVACLLACLLVGHQIVDSSCCRNLEDRALHNETRSIQDLDGALNHFKL